ncbi:MAG: LuxR family transcriptional regulator [Bacteroidales bacterium]|nr:LuxR family transcriptional regulator [Bacteroidales bacterium]
MLLILLSVLCFFCKAEAEYMDHRGHNVDSLETVMAGVTAREVEEADDERLRHIVSDLQGLMYGFNQTNGVKSEYYARMMLRIARRKGWQSSIQDAAKNIGQHFWAKEQYDSAAHYYRVAMEAVAKMPLVENPDSTGKQYSQEDIDNSLSQMYGTLGNLYSMMDSISTAMNYYEKAGELFKKYDWYNSCSVLYYNMGETMRVDGQLRPAEKYYLESLDYSLFAKDSLAIATAYKGLGSLYLDMHKTSKAMRYLNDANLYFADHEDEELQYRMESLDYTSQVLALQKKRMGMIMVLLALSLALMAVSFLVVRSLRKTRQTLAMTAREKEEITEVLEDTVQAISPSTRSDNVTLKPREREVLDLVAKGYTNAQIADAMCLSPETIKWYKKKLFAMFEVANSAELVKMATDRKLL